jgi:CheY-like chemotaxis protein
MGGQIACKSTLGRGATFRFTAPLPRAAAPASPDPSGACEPQRSTGRAGQRVLLVDDNDFNAMVATRFLRVAGFELIERASDGYQAVELALRSTPRPDVILMDCSMPEMDGYEAARQIRREEGMLGLARVPIIAVSAAVTTEALRKCQEVGIDDFLAKPFSHQALGYLVDRCSGERPVPARAVVHEEVL